MALTESTMIELGTKAPDFSLIDVIDGKIKSLAEMKGERATLIFFTCNHCPYVIHIMEKLVEISKKYLPSAVNFIAINSNDIEKYPDDAPDKMISFSSYYNFSFPYLFDETQKVARSYQAACTPDFYLFDNQMILQYRGRFCSSRPKTDIPVTGLDLQLAIDAVLDKRKPTEKQYPSAGCNIKWK